MTGNSGAWGVAMWKDGRGGSIELPQEMGISLEGGDEIVPYLPTEPLGCLVAPPDGLGVPPVRSGDVAFAQRDGVVQFADYYEPRQITLQVIVKNDGCPGCPSVRQKVSRLTEEWSRNCTGATLVLFTDCHNPDATEQERVYLGPYVVRGRPRVADVVWERSNRGAARVTLRFDAADARLLLADTIPGSAWDWEHVQTVDADEQTLLDDPTLSGATMTTNGGTMSDQHLLVGGPDDGPYFQRHVVAPNTTSPMVIELSGDGTDAVPVTAGQPYSLSAWARKSSMGGPVARFDWQWLDAGGAQISLVNGASIDPIDEWQQWSDTRTAPAGAAFLQPRLLWSGIALADQNLDLAMAWLVQDDEPRGPETVDVVGTLCAYPVITLSPNLTAPILVSYGGHTFLYTQDIGVGESVDIDTRWGRASDGFEDVTQYLIGDYSAPLPPGQHQVYVQTGDVTDSGSVTFRWENAVVSG